MSKKRYTAEIEGRKVVFRVPKAFDLAGLFGGFMGLPSWLLTTDPDEIDKALSTGEDFDDLSKKLADIEQLYAQADRLIVKCYIRGQGTILKLEEDYTIKDDADPNIICLADVDPEVKFKIFQDLCDMGGMNKEGLEEARNFREDVEPADPGLASEQRDKSPGGDE